MLPFPIFILKIVAVQYNGEQNHMLRYFCYLVENENENNLKHVLSVFNYLQQLLLIITTNFCDIKGPRVLLRNFTNVSHKKFYLHYD